MTPEERTRAAKEIAEALATIETYSESLPRSVIEGIRMTITDAMNEANNWLQDPEAIRAALPSLFEKVMAKVESDRMIEAFDEDAELKTAWSAYAPKAKAAKV